MTARLLALLVGLAGPAFAADPVVHHYHVVRKGTAYGHMRRAVTREAGRVTIEVRSRILIDLFGKKQEIVLVDRAVVDASGRPLACSHHGKYAAREVRWRGVREGEVLAIYEGDARKGELPAGEGVTFETALPEVLGGRPAATARWTLIDLHERRAVRRRVVIARAGAGGATLTVGEGALTARYRVDASGVFDGGAVAALGITYARVDVAQAGAITHLKTDDGFTLTVETEKDYANPATVLSARLRLRWTRVSPDKMHLVDSRQTLESLERTDGAHVAVIALSRKAAPASKATLPVEGAPAAALAESRYVKPAHPAILAAARRALDGETNALAAARKLSAFVHATIEPSMIAETLSGPEVLEKKTGKCAEFATLMASLCRAAGLPTRFALGLRHMGGRWGGHIWNEVWLGPDAGWVPVDAGANEVGTSGPLLIKLVHGATVEATQGVRFGLVDDLSVALLEVTEQHNPLKGKYVDGLDGRTYTSVAYRCQLRAPEGWTASKGPAGTAAQFTLAVDGVKTNAYLAHFALPAGYTSESLHRTRMAQMKARAKSHVVKRAGPEDWGGGKAHGIVVELDGKLVQRELMLVDGTTVFLLVVYVPRASWAARKADVERLVASFRRLTGAEK